MKVTSQACNDLDLFFDGELEPSAAAEFNAHLAVCKRCERMLLGRMLEAVAIPIVPSASEIPFAPPQLPPPAQKRRWVWACAGAAALAACLALWLLQPPPGVQPPPPIAKVVDALGPHRGIDARLSEPALDRHRPLDVRRSGGPAPIREPISHDSLAALEKRDANAYVDALVLKGDIGGAIDKASSLPETAASFVDRAAIALCEPGDSNKAQANAERALSLARQARRLQPKHPQAMWNEAVALERLQLSLAAAAVFDEVAELREPGWAAEAEERAARLRAAHGGDLERRQPLYDAAIAMIRGGAPMASDIVARDESFARLAFHLAVASTADPARLAALAPLADQLRISGELAPIRASKLAARAPLAREIAAVTSQLTSLLPPRALTGANPLAPSVHEALRKVRDRAKQAGHLDIVRAIALLIEESRLDESDINELPVLSAGGPWWNLVAVERRAYYLAYLALRLVEVEPAVRDVIGNCTDRLWCPRIMRTVAQVTSDMGRVDRGYELAGTALRMARAADDGKEEGRVFYALGQIVARRVDEQRDSAAIADAYMRESALRFPDCRTRLYRLDWRANTAFDYHRYSEAEALLAIADRTQSDCKEKGEFHEPRFNGEFLRVRMLSHRATQDRLARLERQVALLGDVDPKHQNLHRELLLALGRFTAVEDKDAPAELRRVIAKAEQLRGDTYAEIAREEGLNALAEAAARRGAGEEALGAIAARLDIQLEAGCVVAVNHDDVVTIAVRGADNRAFVEIHEPPEGRFVTPAPDLISQSTRARLVGCERIDVIATGAYFGAAGLLPRELRWAYRSSPRRRTPASSGLARQVVVTDVEPPAELGLPALRSMQKPDGAARLVTGSMATPEGVLAAIADAELVVINAHGITDANEPSAATLVLSPDRNGTYWLTAERVKKTRLTGAPVVILAACHAGRVQVSKSPWSLASSFLSAGAQAVIAPTVEIPDDVANEVFGSMVKRMRSGSSPEQAVAEERAARGDVPWLASVVVFQ